MIQANGWHEYCIWEHSSTVKNLYARRCRLEAEEMTCAAQAAELIQPHVSYGDVLLDVGCGSGYFYHSLRKRKLGVEYYGIDAAPSLIKIGRRIMPQYGLSAHRLRVLRIEDLSGEADHIVCMNVLSNIDNYHRPLERILKVARKCVVLRESVQKAGQSCYVTDGYLDEGRILNVYVNTYPEDELVRFIASYGYTVQVVTDRRTGGEPEMVIGYPHHWTFLVAKRRGEVA